MEPVRLNCFGDVFTLQWHLNRVCNLRCRHCYHTNFSQVPLDRSQKLDVLKEIVHFLETLGESGRLHLTGGEPLLDPDLPEIVERARRAGLTHRLLTNGTMVEPALARHLLRNGCVGVQVSLEGDEPTHDSIRGLGSFQAALKGVQRLKQEGLFVTLAMTLHPANVEKIEEMAQLASRIADRVYFSRWVPLGCSKELGEILPAPMWGQALMRIHALAQKNLVPVALRDPTFRPLFAAPWNAHRAWVVAGCAAGFKTLTIECDGSIMPCRRLDLPIGKMGERSLKDFWDHSPILQQLRNRDALEQPCGSCVYRWVCGGCRAIPSALGKGILGGDPQCPWGHSWKYRPWLQHLLNRCLSGS